MARGAKGAAGYWMIHRNEKEENVFEIFQSIHIDIPFAVSVNAFFFIFDL